MKILIETTSVKVKECTCTIILTVIKCVPNVVVPFVQAVRL